MKVRIKMKSRPGDQVDYALATGPMYGHINDYAYSDRDPDIKDTLSGVKRSEANMEAEGGETALGDFNQDGMLEHSKISGKRHHEGGVPLNVPDGTFLFSDTRKLKIKDKAALDYFGSKKPATPAALAKKYDLNKYNAILKDPRASRLEKETADRMIKNHLTKLSELALLQESIKGMPNGVPSFVESVMGGDGQAQYGGFITSDKKLPMFQTGGMSLETAKKLYDEALKSNDISKIKETAEKIRLTKSSNNDPFSWGWVPGSLENQFENLLYKLESKARFQEKNYAQPNLEKNQYQEYYDSNLEEYNKAARGEKSKLTNQDLKTFNEVSNYLKNPSEFYGEYGRINAKAPILNKNKENDFSPVVTNESRKENKTDSTTFTSEPVKIDTVFQKKGSALDLLKKKNGGELVKYQDAGEVVNVEKFPDNTTATTLKDGTIIVKDASGKELGRTKVSPNNNNPIKEVPVQDQYYRYNPLFKDIIEQQDSAGNVIHSRQNLTQPFGVQPARGGVYGFQDYDWDDFVQRHGDWIETEYGDYGGIEGFLKDVQDPAKSKQATTWFQSTINKLSREEFGKDYFAPSSTSPYGVDGEFGAVTFSVPRFFKINQSDPNYKPEVDSPAVPAAEVAKEAPKEEKINEALPFTGTLRPRDSRWYIQDSLNLAGALTDRVDVFEPTRQQVDFQAPDATYLDPSRQIAAAQEQDARYQDVAMNTAEGQVARANILGSSGQTAGQIADVLANYENQNVQIANQNAAQRADVENREMLMNTELDAKYNQEKAIVGQATRNALRELKNRRLLALNTGITNNQKKRMFEQVMFPQVSVDSVTGDWYTTNGRNLQDTVETYTNPALGGTSSMNPLKQVAQIGSQMVQLKKQLINEGMSEEDAKWVMSQSSRSLRPNFETSDQLYRNQLSNFAYPF